MNDPGGYYENRNGKIDPQRIHSRCQRMKYLMHMLLRVQSGKKRKPVNEVTG